VRQRSLFALFGFLVVLYILTNLQLPFTQKLKDGLSDGFMPFLVFSSRVQGSAHALISKAKSYGDLQAQNTELLKQISELSSRVAQIGELERENQDFRAMLDFKNRTELKLITAKVIGRDPSNWWNTVMVDRGTADGITRDMPVLVVDGLVGKTIEVFEHNAHVLLLVDENCKVSGWMRESGQYGIVEGNLLAGGKSAQCRMKFIDRFSKILPNDKVYTSGLGGVFPKGILIGTINTTPSTPANTTSKIYQEVTLIPAVDLSRIDDVFIGVGVKPPERSKPPSTTKKS
jgi:rod shape-determining protein MreC